MKITINDLDDWVEVKQGDKVLHEGHSISSRELAYILKDLGFTVELSFDGEKENL